MVHISFNALTEPWIPVINNKGEAETLGILDTLERAHKIKEISCANLLEEYSIYRFLGLFLTDAFRPQDMIDLEDIRDYCKFDMDRIRDYVNVCTGEGVSFDLFDEKRPFLQATSDPELDREPKPIAKLDNTKPSGNNPIHFDRSVMQETPITPAKAIRLLLANYTVVTVDGAGYCPGINKTIPYFCMVKGENLFETLVYTIFPSDYTELEFDDPPVFWRDNSVIKRDILPTVSWLQGMMLPARRIRLIQDSDGLVRNMFFGPGMKAENPEVWRDPYASYVVNEKTGKRFVVSPGDEGALWRNICVLIEKGSEPWTVTSFRHLHDEDTTQANVVAYGFWTSQAKWIKWRKYTYVLPLTVMDSRTCIDQIRGYMLPDIEAIGKQLNISMKKVSVIGKELRESYVQNFYAGSEGALWTMLSKAEPSGFKKADYEAFVRELIRQARSLYNNVMASTTMRGKDLCASAIGLSNLNACLKKILKGVDKWTL